MIITYFTYFLLSVLVYTVATMQSPKIPERTKIIIRRKNRSGKEPEGGSVMSYALSILVIFIVLSALYSFITTSTSKKSTEIPLSQIATDIKTNLIQSIIVRGDMLDIEYKTG